jgi:hypothetical protein
MKKIIILSGLLLALFQFNSYSQEHYGKTLNLGLGVGGYSGVYKYTGSSFPVFNINYEFDVARNFTLAPFASIYTFKEDIYWSNRYYNYSEVVVPVGIKGYYYFDELLNLRSDWDIYAAASLGLVIATTHWENGYNGDRNYYHKGNAVFLDLHIGASYHFNNRIGAYLDLSSGLSTIGIQINGK